METRLTERCLTDLEMERLLAEELLASERAGLEARLALCEHCQARRAQKLAQEEAFRRSPRASEARRRFARAERNNARGWLMLAAAVPLAGLAAVGLAVWPRAADPDPLLAVATPSTPAATPVRGRTPTRVEVRDDGPAPRAMREVSLQGHSVFLGQGVLEGAPLGGLVRPFVLKHTEVEIDIQGLVQRTTVTQVFENPFSTAVEAVYLFPLPDDSAVDEMELEVGSRRIQGQIQLRHVARQMYEQAKQEGRHAALLDQERPNLFTQSVANILPGETVKVRLGYTARTHFDDGVFELNFPLTVGPRYVPGHALGGLRQGNGTAPDTDEVLDGSRVTPPQMRTGRDVRVKVRLDASLPIESIWSVSHQLLSHRGSESSMEVWLDEADRIPNKDLILRWTVGGPTLRASAVAHGTGGAGSFALMLVPQSKDQQPAPLPREMVFVIDSSCSMKGPPLAAAKQVVSMALEQLNPDDSFMIIGFSDRASSFHPVPLPNTPQNVERALSYIRALPASGGTNQLAGIRSALGRPHNPHQLRTVLLLTDGFIGNELQVLGECERLLGQGRLFGFGIGSSVNHYLLSRLSDSGRGFYQYLRPDENPTVAVARFLRRLERPLLTDITVDFGGLKVDQLIPERIPDLFDAQPLVVLGRYTQPGAGTVTLRGRRGAEWVEVKADLVLPAEASAHPSLGQLWARARIDVLERERHHQETPELVRQISTLGLEYKLMTPYTSFVAVDVQRVAGVGGRTPPTVAVPAEPDEAAASAGPERWSARGSGPAGLMGKMSSSGPQAPAQNSQPSSQAVGILSGLSANRGDAHGLGGLGIRGVGKGGGGAMTGADAPHGGSGYGVGAGVLGASPRADKSLDATTSHKGGEKGIRTQPVSKPEAAPPPTASTMAPAKPVVASPAPPSTEVTGALSKDVLQAVIQRQLGAVKEAYLRRAKQKPGLRGRLMLRIEIGADGQVKSARVTTSTLHDDTFEREVERLVLRWRFPSSSSPVVVSYPLNFVPEP